MTNDTDPVGNGFVASLARPGGNITGLSTLAPELSGKRLELLKEIVPKLSRVAVLGTSTDPGNAQVLREMELAAGAFKVKLQYLDVLGPKDIETAFRAASKGRADAVLVLASPVLNSQRTQIADLAVKNRLPAIYHEPEFVEAGGLMTYGVSFPDLYRRAATYVDKILKGAKPADLPVEQPTKFELVINLKAAKQIGLTIPPNVLARADRVIKMTESGSDISGRQKRREQCNRVTKSFAWRLALVLLAASRRGAATNENPADRIPIWCIRSRCLGPHRGIPAGPARAWVRGGKKHCHRVSICRGKTRSPPLACGRTSTSQGRHHRLEWCDSNPCRQGSHGYDPHCHGAGSRSCWQRVRRQPRAAWREHHWIVDACARS